MKTRLNATLDPKRRSDDADEFETALRRTIVGQDPAIEKVAEVCRMFLNNHDLAAERQDPTPEMQSKAPRGMYVLILDWKLAAVVATFVLVILKNFVMPLVK